MTLRFIFHSCDIEDVELHFHLGTRLTNKETFIIESLCFQIKGYSRGKSSLFLSDRNKLSTRVLVPAATHHVKLTIDASTSHQMMKMLTL